MLQVHSIRIHCILQSVIQLINQTSQGFKEGKKWKCNSRCGTRGGNSTRTFRDRLASQKTNTCRCKRICSQCDISDAEDAAMLSHSKTVDHSDVRIKNRSRQLVRQHATTSENSSENRRLKPAGGLPCRQWTTDASFSETDAEPSQTMKSKATSSPMVMSSNSNAFLLRPLSRNSAQPTKENQTPADLQSTAVKAAIAAAVAAAKGPKGTSPSDHLSMNSYGPEIRSAPNGTIHQSRLRKQRTTESAPNNHPPKVDTKTEAEKSCLKIVPYESAPKNRPPKIVTKSDPAKTCPKRIPEKERTTHTEEKGRERHDNSKGRGGSVNFGQHREREINDQCSNCGGG